MHATASLTERIHGVLPATAQSSGQAAQAPASPPELTWLRTQDGTRVASTWFLPKSVPNGVVVIASAMGISQRFYAPLATWLAEQGVAVLTFDYRGVGASRLKPLKHEHANIHTWAEQDAGAALAQAHERFAGLPITWLGHSLGGQIPPLVPGIEAVAQIVLVAAGSGYWRHNSPQLLRKVWLFWWGAVPVLTPLYGYFPGKSLGMVGDLPRGVITQWKQWCMHKDYAVGAEGDGLRKRYAAIRTPVTAISFQDDELLSQQAFRTLYNAYTGAPRLWRHWKPAELGVKRVGHFGFFRPELAEPVWRPHLLPEIERQLTPSAR